MDEKTSDIETSDDETTGMTEAEGVDASPEPAAHTEAGTAAPRLSLTDEAVERLRSRIIDLTLPPGARLDEAVLLREFKLGRTPAREAINRLVVEKFVVLRPHRGGAFVRALDLEEIGDIVAAHQLSENVLGQLLSFDDPNLADDLQEIQNAYAPAVRRRDYLVVTELNEKFHLRLNEAVHNRFILDFARSVHGHLRRLLIHLYRLEAADPAVHNEQFGVNIREHDEIIGAIREKDRTRVVALLQVHARATQRRLLHILESRTVELFPVSLPIPLHGQRL